MHTLGDIYTRILTRSWKGTIGLSSSTERLGCHELAEKLESTKAALATQVAHGDVVILKVGTTIESAIGLFSLWSLGAVIVPVKNNMADEAIISIAEDCNAKFLYEPAKDDLQTLVTYRSQETCFVFHFSQAVCGSDRALIIYTSGSTGNPKGIILSHNNVISALRSISDYLCIDEQEVILNISPLSFDYGLYQLLFAIYKDCSVVLFDQSMNPITLVKALENHQVTLLPVLPVVATLLEKGVALSKKSLPALKKLTNTGGHLDETLIDALQDCLPDLQIFAMYGLTESKRALYLPPEDLKRKRGSVGIPMPGLTAAVFVESPERGRFVEAKEGEVGRLFVRGPSVMQGYTRSDSEAGAKLISGHYREDNWLDTGDLFVRDHEGYFYFKGRAKELIKQGGYCLYAADIEKTVASYPAIQFASVVGTHDRFGNEAACLFVKIHEEYSSDHPSVITWIKETLGQDYCPRVIKVVDDVKLSVNGKIDKKQMLAVYG